MLLNKRTIIGTGVGAAIIVVGVYFLVTSFGIQTINVNDTYAVGESTTYQFDAPTSSKQFVNITGSSFNVDLKSPEGGLQIKEKDFKNELSIEWVHLIDGQSTLRIQNTGDSDIKISGYFTVLTDPLLITYHIIVITAGVVIIGFSAGFSIRKPSGF